VILRHCPALGEVLLATRGSILPRIAPRFGAMFAVSPAAGRSRLLPAEEARDFLLS
jgi:hypothetical protein